MQRPDFAGFSAPPDLLRRFVQTAYKAIYRIAEVPVLVQSNDITLLPPFPLDCNFEVPREELFEWKLVRDVDTREALETAVILNCRALAVAHMGPACLLALDQERRELLGFIGAGIDTSTYREFLIPFMQRMTENAFAGRVTEGAVQRARGSIYG